MCLQHYMIRHLYDYVQVCDVWPSDGYKYSVKEHLLYSGKLSSHWHFRKFKCSWCSGWPPLGPICAHLHFWGRRPLIFLCTCTKNNMFYVCVEQVCREIKPMYVAECTMHVQECKLIGKQSSLPFKNCSISKWQKLEAWKL